MIRWLISGVVAVIVGFLVYQFLMPSVMFALVVAVNSFVIAAWIPLKNRGRATGIIVYYPLLMWLLTSIMCTALHITDAISVIVLLTSVSSITLSGKFVKERV